MKLFGWIKPASASVAELEAQLNAARAHVAIVSADVQKEQSAFDHEPSDSAERVLLKARDAWRGAREHEDRAERLLQAAREREASERRRSLEKRRAELQAALSYPELERLRGPALHAEIEAMKSAVTARLARRAIEQKRLQLEDELYALECELEPDQNRNPPSRQVEPHVHPVHEALRELAQQCEGNDARRYYFIDLAGGHGNR